MACDFRKHNGRKRTLFDRFMEKVIIVSDSGCWIWMGATDSKGYGQMRVDGRLIQAHRLSYELFNGGEIAERDCCHSCDVPQCVNPSHLWAGSRAENLEDMAKKGRARKARGAEHFCAKLTPADAMCIFEDDRPPAIAAEVWGVSEHTIRDIRTRRTWRWVTQDLA